MFACPATEHFFSALLDHMIDLRHPLVMLASRMPWQQIEASVSHLLSRKARTGTALPNLDLFVEQVTRAAINAAVDLKLLKAQDLPRVIVDSMGQHKAIAHPTDSPPTEVALAGVCLGAGHQRAKVVDISPPSLWRLPRAGC